MNFIHTVLLNGTNTSLVLVGDMWPVATILDHTALTRSSFLNPHGVTDN